MAAIKLSVRISIEFLRHPPHLIIDQLLLTTVAPEVGELVDPPESIQLLTNDSSIIFLLIPFVEPGTVSFT